MQKRLFSIYDSKAKVFSAPFTSINSATAIRDFQRAACDPSSDICNFPEDYTLFEMASFDDNTGVIDYNLTPVNLGLAAQFKNPMEG
ncbi:MAG: nonstructural protein [Microviridae sp.]|nr:MAG: nonstructural protein [Microviridae sp.]